MSEEVKVVVLINKKVDGLDFKEAIYFTQDEYAALSESDIDAIIQTRIDNWIASRNELVLEIEKTEEQLQQELIELDSFKDQIDTKKIQLTDKLTLAQTAKLKAPIKE